ncbi:MAG: peptide chain release factor N(5)-glutamine methyltransferase [Rhodospirillales bacterium]|nr:peptide chain release factor N(5)-glutamine methyltransferase [Alphaproteobacteria bacterium]MCB9987518.1 peptide chain release factor N(5)-glutamine methyltransferase [Rhodospirillales bacterium]USO07508.1 MAG: peptide chain release factor N(5)-glutamine methyltransferase [Rhodospirillales bacterium]
MRLGDLYQSIRARLRDAGLETPDLDARLLIAHATGCAPDDTLLKPDAPVTPSARLDEWIARRIAREPVSKIIGRRGFYGLEFEVTPDVLDPRPDTEALIDAAREAMPPDARILDLCTGSGCIALTLLTLFPGARATATDISAAALDVAKRNAARLNLQNRATFVQASWLDRIDGVFDCIACNPPYIPAADIAGLDDGVRFHDPLLALDGGADGLDPYRIVFPQIRARLAPDARAYFECGAGQAGDVARLGAQAGLRVIETVRDLDGRERVVVLA